MFLSKTKFRNLYNKLLIRPSSHEIDALKAKKSFSNVSMLIVRELFYVLRTKNLSRKSSCLTYTFTLALVPFTAFLFSLFHGFGGVQSIFQSSIEPLILKHFGVTLGADISRYFDIYLSNLNTLQLGIIPFCMFFITVVFSFIELENQFDEILDRKGQYTFFKRFFKYWIIITLLPFFFFVLSFKTIKFIDISVYLPFLYDIDVSNMFYSIFNFIVQIMIFSFIYYIIPSARQRALSVLCGGFIAGVLFEILHLLNSLFISYMLSKTNEQVYGSITLIAIVSLFILKLNCLVLLLGMSLSSSIERILAHLNHVLVTHSPLLNIFNTIKVYSLISKEFKVSNKGLSFLKLTELSQLNSSELILILEFLVRKEVLMAKENLESELIAPSYLGLSLEKIPEKFFQEVIFSDLNIIEAKESLTQELKDILKGHV